jgi:hypothetical protein
VVKPKDDGQEYSNILCGGVIAQAYPKIPNGNFRPCIGAAVGD